MFLETQNEFLSLLLLEKHIWWVFISSDIVI